MRNVLENAPPRTSFVTLLVTLFVTLFSNALGNAFLYLTSWVGGRQRRLRVAWAQNV